MKVKAITISQPWADLIRWNLKMVENRTWPCSHRGTLAIHAGNSGQYLSKVELAKYTTGAVVATAEMVACLDLRQLRQADPELEIEGTRYTVGKLLDHMFTEGPYLWVLDNIRPIKPIVVPGKQGLWVWDVEQSSIEFEEVAAQVSGR